MARRQVRYEPDAKGIAGLALDPKMYAALTKITEHAKAYAESISPHGRTGDYARSFAIRPTTKTLGWRHEPRATVILENTSDHAIGVEVTNKDRVLGKTAKFVDSAARTPKPSGPRRRSKPSGM